jgi:serine/threonine-protein kinase
LKPKGDLPKPTQAYTAIGAIQRREGKWAESTASLEKAAALDPKNAMILSQLALNCMALRDFDAADKTLDRASAAAPQAFGPVGLKVYLAVLSKGDLTLAEKQLSSIAAGSDPDGSVTWTRWWLLRLQRNFPEALAVAEKFPGQILFPGTAAPVPKALLKGDIHWLQGNKPQAQIEFEQARIVSENLLREAPENSRRHAQHGLILAALGLKQEAIAEGDRAVELLPESQDAFEGPQIAASLAKIYALTGESGEAVRLIDHLLRVPNGLTVPILKLDPAWDPLRKDPLFQKLCENNIDIAALPDNFWRGIPEVPPSPTPVPTARPAPTPP